MVHKVKVINIEPVTHNVKRFTLEKPENYSFIPGQATDIFIDEEGWRDAIRPFTFTNLNTDEFLEFTIKAYPERKGVTEKLHTLKSGSVLGLDEPFGTISYKNEGVFLAGGAGVTPFIAILRSLSKDGKLAGNKLIFSNKTSDDVILEHEFKSMFSKSPDNLILTLSQEKVTGYEHGRIDRNLFIKYVSDFSTNFYVCGPKQFVTDLKKILTSLGASMESIVFEE